jgi:serine/threonine protein kinase
MAAESSPPPPASGSQEPGMVVAEKYRLVRLMRSGGMGSLWEALHLGLDSPVVVKFVRFDRIDPVDGADGGLTEQRLRARFEREAKAAAQIRSANVVQTLDYGVDRGVPYLVLELLQGEDLAARLERVGRLGVTETARILGQVARALERAHGAGMVHRDLKPENVFLAIDGSEEVAKVLDFGVAKEHHKSRKSDDSTVDGVVIGTPSYMSPEQAMGRTDVDHRSDLWSLGVIAFRALTGTRPFESPLLLEQIVKICSGPIPVPSEVAPDLGPEVDAFFQRALAREPEQRFQSARELARELEALATDDGVGSDSASSALDPRPRSRVTLVGVAALVVGIAALAFLATRSPSTARDAAAGESPAPPSATSPPAIVAPEPPRSAELPAIPLVSAPTAAPLASTAPVVSSPPPTKPRSAPSGRPPQRPPTGKKPRADVGY